jgi:AAA15 family ATPase/GTPase
MREIVYFWISNFRNIQNQGFNFGSEYEYYTEIIDNKIVTKRKKNDFYIPNFFQTKNNNSILNISAFVGENGAGKSNFLDALKSALTGDRDLFEYLIVYKDANGEVFCDKNFDNLKVEYEFKQSEGTSAFTEVIYYNPALDNKIYPITHDNNVWIDISTDWLIFKDSEEQKSTKPNLSQIELFGAEEIERQLKLSNDSNFVMFLNEKINIPSEIRIVSVAGDFPSKIDGINSSVRNVPYKYRNYYDLFYEMGMIVNQYAKEERKIQIEREIPDDINPYTRKKCFATFLDHLLKNMFYHFESTNQYLDKGNIGVSLDDLKKLDYEEAVYTFIKNIDLIDNTDAIINFIEYTKTIVFNAKVEFSNYGEISWVTPKDDLKNFLILKDEYLNQLSKFLDYNVPRSFISYSWTGLSTGEKAMFNLFSRFYFAKSQIIEKKYNHNKTPNMLYILIDEAESGFHLQWQKEYVNDIIEFIPKTLIFNTADEKLYPKIQLIFTTHSTLTLSDIPNTHISYIRTRDKKAYVLKGEEKPNKSFGANVHTLMSDSFFLRNGLVGSFAIKKINEIIAILNSEKPSAKEIEMVKAVINIIDEPILKTKLLSMLSKFDNSSEYEIKRLEQMKLDIESRIKKLKNND